MFSRSSTRECRICLIMQPIVVSMTKWLHDDHLWQKLVDGTLIQFRIYLVLTCCKWLTKRQITITAESTNAKAHYYHTVSAAWVYNRKSVANAFRNKIGDEHETN